MANEQRVRYNVYQGTILDNPLTTTSTVITSTNFATLPAVSNTQHLVLVLNPSGASVPSSSAEVIYVTSHTSGATAVTVVRAREGSTASGYNSTATWVHGPLVSDHAPTIVDTNASLPASGGLPFEGQLGWLMDANTLKVYDGAAWQNVYYPGAWTAWSPTFGGGWASGNASAGGFYTKFGRTVHARGFIQLGSTTSIGTGMVIQGLPVATASSVAPRSGSVTLLDTSSGLYYPAHIILAASTTSFTIQFHAVDGAVVRGGDISAPNPFAWAAGDYVEFSLTYEAAS